MRMPEELWWDGGLCLKAKFADEPKLRGTVSVLPSSLVSAADDRISCRTPSLPSPLILHREVVSFNISPVLLSKRSRRFEQL